MEIIVIILLLAAFVFCAGLFMNTLAKTLKQIQFGNRKMQPDQIWLLFIPFFNYYWLFRVVNAISESVDAEYSRRGLTSPVGTSTNIGYVYAGAFALNAVIALSNQYLNAGIPNFLGSLVSLASLIFWIAYWILISGIKKQLQLLPKDEDSLIFGSLPVEH